MTDQRGDVYERNGEGNNVVRLPDPIDVTLQPSDLARRRWTAPTAAVAGAVIQVGWTVSNQGPRATDETTWQDAAYLSADDVFEPAGDIELGVIGRAGSLGPGESYSRMEPFTLRQDLAGPYRVYVVTDARRQVFEHQGEENNTLAAASEIAIDGIDVDLQTTLSALAPRWAAARCGSIGP